MSEQTARQRAEEQVDREESARRNSRVAELEREETQRQEAERAGREVVEARQKAADEAAELVESRAPLESRITSLASELDGAVEEIVELHDRHLAALQASLDPEYLQAVHDGIALGLTPSWARSAPDVRQVVRSYLEGSLPALYPSASAAKGSLSEVDPLTPADPDDMAGRPVGEFPWDKLEQAKRELAARDEAEREQGRASEAAGKIRQLQARHADLRNRYARPISFGELVPSEERGELEDLLTPAELDLARSIVEAWV